MTQQYLPENQRLSNSERRFFYFIVRRKDHERQTETERP